MTYSTLCEPDARSSLIRRTIENAVVCWLTACVITFIAVSWSWPLTGDASLLHYVVFLMHHGIQPYGQIVEMNLPGSYLLESVAMATLGPDSIGCRLYDLALLALSSFSLLVILRPYGRLAAVLAAALFVLIHGRDGPLMSAERDLAATALLLAAVAMAFTLFRKADKGLGSSALPLFAGASMGTALSIKPTLLPLVASVCFWIVWSWRKQSRIPRRIVALTAIGIVLSFVPTLVFLVEHRAMKAFWRELHGLILYHASMHRWPVGHLLQHSIQPLLPMLLLWIIAAYVLRKETMDPERIALLLCAVCGLLSYVFQGKAFWYQRYPFLAFLLPIFVIDFSRLLRSRSCERWIGSAGIATGVLLTTICLLHLVKYDRAEPPRQMLRDLATYGTPEALSGHIQCLDTIGGCIDDLYHARIVQSTGFLYDCYLLDGTNAVALGLRQRFWQQMERNPPRVIVMTNSDCYEGQHTFERFGQWPEFQQYLEANYTLARESGPLPPVRYWSHPMEAYQYRIYLHR